MCSRLAPALMSHVFAWMPACSTVKDWATLCSAYHEAAHFIYSHDLHCKPKEVVLGNPGWGVEHCGCQDETSWFTVMSAGAAASYLLGKAWKGDGARTHASLCATLDAFNLKKLLDEVAADPEADGYKAPTEEELGARMELEIDRIAAEIESDEKVRDRIDRVAKFLYEAFAGGTRSLSFDELYHLP